MVSHLHELLEDISANQGFGKKIMLRKVSIQPRYSILWIERRVQEISEKEREFLLFISYKRQKASTLKISDLQTCISFKMKLCTQRIDICEWLQVAACLA